MKAILFLAASILALTSAVLADECTWGVSYWCQNKANAEKCDKVSYCNDHVWNQKGKEGIDDLKDAILLRGSPVRQFYKKYDQKPTEPQSIQCEICKVVVKEAVKYLDDNKTEVSLSLSPFQCDNYYAWYVPLMNRLKLKMLSKTFVLYLGALKRLAKI
jgi:hypothetical protein